MAQLQKRSWIRRGTSFFMTLLSTPIQIKGLYKTNESDYQYYTL